MTLLAIDPGETVGWALYNPETRAKLDGGQTDWGQFPRDLAFSLAVGHADSVNVRPSGMGPRIPFGGVTEIVIEDFVIYPPDVSSGPPPYWDPVITARVIGAIATIAEMAAVPVSYQGANIKSDALAAAAEEDFSRPLYENRHENDATMHATYFLARRLAERLNRG